MNIFLEIVKNTEMDTHSLSCTDRTSHRSSVCSHMGSSGHKVALQDVDRG